MRILTRHYLSLGFHSHINLSKLEAQIPHIQPPTHLPTHPPHNIYIHIYIWIQYIFNIYIFNLYIWIQYIYSIYFRFNLYIYIWIWKQWLPKIDNDFQRPDHDQEQTVDVRTHSFHCLWNQSLVFLSLWETVLCTLSSCGLNCLMVLSINVRIHVVVEGAKSLLYRPFH